MLRALTGGDVWQAGLRVKMVRRMVRHYRARLMANPVARQPADTDGLRSEIRRAQKVLRAYQEGLRWAADYPEALRHCDGCGRAVGRMLWRRGERCDRCASKEAQDAE